MMIDTVNNAQYQYQFSSAEF